MQITWKLDALEWMDMYVDGKYYGWSYRRSYDDVSIIVDGDLATPMKTVEEARAYLIALWALRGRL